MTSHLDPPLYLSPLFHEVLGFIVYILRQISI